MQRVIVNPYQVYGFAEHRTGVGKKLLARVEERGWKDIPPVPCFRVPSNVPEREHEFMLLDGNNRLMVARHRNDPLPIIVYEQDEPINATQDGLAPARALTDPNRYTTILRAYQNRRERKAREHPNP